MAANERMVYRVLFLKIDRENSVCAFFLLSRADRMSYSDLQVFSDVLPASGPRKDKAD
jgi:hypothetical protein